jgi:hypothetical protein
MNRQHDFRAKEHEKNKKDNTKSGTWSLVRAAPAPFVIKLSSTWTLTCPALGGKYLQRQNIRMN